MNIKRKNIEILQAFRAIAALMVVFYHSTGDYLEKYNQEYIFKIFDQGFIGVDFFFILSGFIIFYVHHPDLGKKDKFNNFIIKRFIRVYPIHWIATSLMFIAFVLSGYGDNLVSNIKVIVSSYLLTPNPVYLNGVIWTLSHEILFYSLLIAWLTLTMLSFFGVAKFESFIMNFLFSKFNIEFALGSFSAYLVLNNKLIHRRLILLSGILLSGISWGILHLELISLDRIIAYGLPFTLVIIGAASIAYQEDVKTPKLLKYLGDASYSIYLIHLLFLNALIKIFGILKLPETIGYFLTMNLINLLTIIMSCVFYQLVEKPLLSGINVRMSVKKKAISFN
ncbi:acyltransferase family protein [Psychrobacillus sp. L3]|uniref:acyltransferase family protein n=1 Tax=Psychrobacillus sp. L3 TaxID=3236891 RepID=UPI0036F1C805